MSPRLTSTRLVLTALVALLIFAAPTLTADPAGEVAGKVVLPASVPADGVLARFLDATEAPTLRQLYRHAIALPKDERQQLHAELRGLSEIERAAFKAAMPRGEGVARTRRADLAPEATGTVQYDTGVAHGSIPIVAGIRVVGNRFSGAFQGNPHSVSKVTFQVNGNFMNSLNHIRVYGAPGTGTTASVLASSTLNNTVLGAPVVFTLPAAVTGLTGSFLAGVLQVATGPVPVATPDNPAVDINDGGQGFHGMTISLNGGGFNPSPTVAPGVPFNTIVRATGNNLPVELMSFSIDE